MKPLHSTLSLLIACAALATTSSDVTAQGDEGAPPTDAAAEPAKPPATDAREAASAAYKEGRQAFEAGEFNRALEAFRQSYGLVQSPNSHLMIAKSLHELGEHVEAYKEMVAAEQEADQAAAENDAYIDTLNAAREVLSELRSAVGLVRLTVVGGHADLPEGSTITIGGQDVPRQAWDAPFVAAPGSIAIVLRTPNGTTEQTVSVSAGDDLAIPLERPAAAAPPPDPDEGGEWFEENRMLMAYIAGGVGAAGLITFGIFGGMTLSTYGDLDDTCPDGNCPVGSQEDIDAGQTYQTVANVGLVIGLVGAAASATLFLLPMLTGSDEGASEEEMAAARRHPPLTIGVGPGALTIGGHF